MSPPTSPYLIRNVRRIGLLRYYKAETAKTRDNDTDIEWKNDAGVLYPIALQPLRFP